MSIVTPSVTSSTPFPLRDTYYHRQLEMSTETWRPFPLDAHLKELVLSIAPFAHRACRCYPSPPTSPGSDSEDFGDDSGHWWDPSKRISIRYLCGVAKDSLPTALVINFRDDTTFKAHITVRLFHVTNWLFAMSDKRTAGDGEWDLEGDALDERLRKSLKEIKDKVFYVSG
jgi:hypothetical protein